MFARLTSRSWSAWSARPRSTDCPSANSTRSGARSCSRLPFETFERKIRDQLGRALGGGGFDPARDIEGIAVNRWPHGYAPEYNSLVDGDTPPEQHAERHRP